MKSVILSICLLLVISVGVFSRGSDDNSNEEMMVVTPTTMGEYSIGTVISEIESELGEADRVMGIFHIYDEIGLSFIVKNDTVVGITKLLYSGSPEILVDGVKISNKLTLEEAHKLFKMENTLKSNDKQIFNNGDYQLEFYISDDIFYLQEFEIGENFFIPE